MEIKTTEPIICILAGKARHGKNASAAFVHEYCEQNNLKHIDLAYSNYIKDYAKKISNWDGSDETKPRELLQQLGTNIIRQNLGDNFFINRMIDDLRVYAYFFDVITIDDARFPKEIDLIKAQFKKVYGVHVLRPHFDNGLTKEQQAHPTETALDHYTNYDYEIINDGSLADLKLKVEEVMANEFKR